MDKILSALGGRMFLMNNVHENEPVVFQTRWAMSYLRGPLTRDQIRELTKGRISETPTSESLPVESVAAPEHPATPISGQLSRLPDLPLHHSATVCADS
jgi:hypothetical protein